MAAVMVRVVTAGIGDRRQWSTKSWRLRGCGDDSGQRNCGSCGVVMNTVVNGIVSLAGLAVMRVVAMMLVAMKVVAMVVATEVVVRMWCLLRL